MRNGLTEGNISSLKENKIHLTGIEINEEENEIKDDIENEIKMIMKTTKRILIDRNLQMYLEKIKM